MREGTQFIRCKDDSLVAVAHVVRIAIKEPTNPVCTDIARLTLTTGEIVEAPHPFDLRALPVSVVAGAQTEPMQLAARDRPQRRIDPEIGGVDTCTTRWPRERAPA